MVDMKLDEKYSTIAASLRQIAENQISIQSESIRTNVSDSETTELQKELQTHRIELQMQIEELILTKQQAVATAEKYTILYDFAPISYFTLEQDGTISGLNLSAAKLVGMDRSSLLNLNLKQFITQDSISTFNSILKQAVTADSNITGEVQLIQDGIPSVFLDLEVTFSPEEQKLLVTGKDVTERKKMELELMAAKLLAQESNRLKSEFLANISHEIHTPMHGILGFLQLLEEDNLSQEKRQKFIAIIKKNTNNLLTILGEIVEISKIENKQLNFNMVDFNLNSLLEDILANYENEKVRLGKKEIVIQLVKGLTDSDSNMYCDNIRLTRVLSNLMGNALKFTDKGYIRLSYRVEPDQLLFSIEDTGSGIAENKQHFIFDRFWQEENANWQHGGMGLGLAISKGIIELMGGTIRFKSEPGKGSSFFFTLPGKFLIKKLSDLTIPPGQNAQGEMKLITILVAEDILINFELIKYSLQNTNTNLLHVTDGQKAIDICQINAEIGLVPMDVRMPVMNGLDATAIIRKFRPNLPIIALTAEDSDVDKTKYMEAGCNDILKKPFNKKDIFALLTNYIPHFNNGING